MTNFYNDEKIINRLISSNDYIECVSLFGSTARGDNDEFSDIDIFILIDDCDEKEFIKIKRNVANQLDCPAKWISLYRISNIIKMHEYGSYFLWHIKQEGIILYSRTGMIERITSTLPKYKKVRDDLLEYQEICNDIKKSTNKDEHTLFYELALLASLVRNTCIALAYLNDKFAFGRMSSVTTCKMILGSELPFELSEYEELYKFRLSYTRDIYEMSLPDISVSLVEKWIERTSQLIFYALEQERRRYKKDVTGYKGKY